MIYTAVPGRAIPLGFLGENRVEAVVFDRTCWLTEYGPGTFELIHRRRQDTDPFPVAVTVSGGAVTWIPTESDTAYRGVGECQLSFYTPDGKLKKSEIYQTVTARSLTSAEDPPSPAQGWVEQVLQAAAGIQNMQADAETLAPGSAATVTKTVDPDTGVVTLTFGIPEGLKGDTGRGVASMSVLSTGEWRVTYTDGTTETVGYDVYSALDALKAAAQEAAETASDKATEAASSARNAEQDADRAEQGAKDAQTSATAAQQAKTDAETAKTDAETAARNAEHDADRAEQGAEDAQASATEAQQAKTDAEDARERAETAAQTLVLDPTLKSPTQAAEAKAVGDAVNTTNKIVALDFPIALNTPSAGSGYISSNGNVGSNINYNHTDYIDISNYAKVLYKRGTNTGTAVQYTAVYNSDKELIRAVRWQSNAETTGYLDTPGTINVVAGDKYARFTMFADTDTYGEFSAYIESTPLSNRLQTINDNLTKKVDKTLKTGINIFDPESAVSGYIKDTGSISSGASYITSDYIPIKNEQRVYVNRIRTFLAFDVDKNPITDSYVSTTHNNFVYTATQDGYIRASLFTSYADSNIIAYGGKPTYYEPYNSEIAVEPGVHLSNEMISDVSPYSGNVLDGKKWVACGDSFTHGDFQRSLTDDYVFTDSPYYGQNKVYPFWIGRRNRGLTVINEAISGSTMTAGDGGVNPFSGTRYTAIPADTDYITLMFGINDSGNNCPIGTIDDTDNTTFYGAWNVVLEYFITNFPYAHIGIIVGPGMQTTQAKLYAEAEIAVAKKWGIPYLNIQFESGGEKIPLMLRTSNPDVSATAKALRNSQQYVNNVEGSINMHPNERAHEFESTFIEAWLRTL